jgi:hypothetical protein
MTVENLASLAAASTVQIDLFLLNDGVNTAPTFKVTTYYQRARTNRVDYLTSYTLSPAITYETETSFNAINMSSVQMEYYSPQQGYIGYF